MPRTHVCGVRNRHDSESSSGGFTHGAPENKYAPSLQLEPTHMDIKIDVDLSKKTALLEVTTKVICNHPSSQTLVLNGVGFLNLVVKSNNPITWTYDGSLITVHWETIWKKGEERLVVVSYKVDHPISGLNISFPDDAYPNRPTFAQTDHETERGRYWLACVDYPTVRTTLKFEITANKEYKTVANGKCTETRTEGNKSTSVWELNYPCPSYLICWATGLFVEVKDENGPNGIPITYLAPVEVKPEDLKLSFGETIGIMKFLESRLGVPFPFREYKYYQIVTPFCGGAMENISLTTWDYRFLCNSTWAKDFKIWTDVVNCHEMTHSYFGDSVVCRFFEHSWLKESWAEFMEKEWSRFHFGNDEANYQAFIDGFRYKEETKEYIRPIVEKKYNTSWNIFDMHTYPGGAWRLNQLKNILGEDTFWSAVTEYLNTYAKKVVETDDFRKILEKHSGRNLTKYFDQWFFGLGYPKLKVKYEHSPAKKEVKVELEQTQVDSKTGVQLFDLQILVEVTDSQGGVHQKEAIFENSASSSLTFSLPSSSAPSSVIIDPNYVWIMDVDFNPGFDLLKYTLVHTKSVPHRIWAATQLAKEFGTLAAFEVIKEAMRKETFYGVLIEVAKCAGSLPHSPFAQDLILDMLNYVKHPRPLGELLRACGAKYPHLRQALLSYINQVKKDPSTLTYNALSNAFEALGNHNNSEDLGLLQDAVKTYEKEGYYAYISAGAIRGIGKHRSKEAYSFLAQNVVYGKLPDYVRPFAASSLARVASWLDANTIREAVEILESLLSEQFFHVIKGAITGLVTLGSKSSIPAIENSQKLVSNQDQDWIQRKVAELQESNKNSSQISELKSELEKLQQKLSEVAKKLN